MGGKPGRERLNILFLASCEKHREGACKIVIMGSGKKIVVAEDDSGIRDAFLLTLTRAGYEVALYADGQPLMTHPFEVPDLFIIDRQLSGVDGLDVCQYLK